MWFLKCFFQCFYLQINIFNIYDQKLVTAFTVLDKIKCICVFGVEKLYVENV